MYGSVRPVAHIRTQLLPLVLPLQAQKLRRACKAAPANNDLPPPEVRKLAQLAQLSVTDEEVICRILAR